MNKIWHLRYLGRKIVWSRGTIYGSKMDIHILPSLKLTASLHLKMDGKGRRIFAFGRSFFQGLSFRECVTQRYPGRKLKRLSTLFIEAGCISFYRGFLSLFFSPEFGNPILLWATKFGYHTSYFWQPQDEHSSESNLTFRANSLKGTMICKKLLFHTTRRREVLFDWYLHLMHLMTIFSHFVCLYLLRIQSSHQTNSNNWLYLYIYKYIYIYIYMVKL